MYIENKPRQVALIFSASLAGFMALLDGNIVNISLPYIARYFHVGTGSAVQIILVYMVVMAGSGVLMPQGFSPDGTYAGMVTPGTLTSGFRWAYAGGTALCLVALILSATLQDRKIGKPVGDGEATLL